MTPFDYVVIVIIALSLLIGLWRGVVGEILALLAWVAAFWAARSWAEPAGQIVAAGMTEPLWRQAWLAPPFETAVLAAKPWLPPDLAKRIRYR
ncbi:MAG: CvpA family protein [Anaerolineae bacterium]|nr:CvpA family protein [Anaerolineae bacterium]